MVQSGVRTFAIILAAGTGSRMNTVDKLPKQFIELNGETILMMSLKKFLAVNEIEKVYLSINEEWKSVYLDILDTLSANERNRVVLVHGGNSRAESLHLAMMRLRADILPTCIEDKSQRISVLSHDAARPFISSKLIRDHINKLAYHDIVATVLSASDTMYYAKDMLLVDVPERKNCFHAQTPQSITLDKYFKEWESYIKDRLQVCIGKEIEDLSIKYNCENDLQALLNIHSQSGGEKIIFENLTDLISMIDLKKNQVILIEGDKMNFKITTDFDLQMAQLIVERNINE